MSYFVNLNKNIWVSTGYFWLKCSWTNRWIGADWRQGYRRTPLGKNLNHSHSTLKSSRMISSLKKIVRLITRNLTWKHPCQPNSQSSTQPVHLPSRRLQQMPRNYRVLLKNVLEVGGQSTAACQILRDLPNRVWKDVKSRYFMRTLSLSTRVVIGCWSCRRRGPTTSWRWT